MKKTIHRALTLMLCAALLLGGALPVAASAEGADAIEAILSGMTLRDKLAQMMMPAFRGWKQTPDGEDAGAMTLNDEMRRCLAENRFGGVIIFSENCRDAEQLLRLTADMQQANREGGGLPLMISADQEGGIITRLGFGTSGPGAMALAATGDAQSARAMAQIFGEELALVGINADLAPVADVNSNPSNPVIGVRSFGDDALQVAEYSAAFIRGLHDAGVIATAKHFPGHGDTDVDSHTGLPLVNATLDELTAGELIPFRAAVEAGVDMVMTAHIQFPQIETQTYTSLKGEEIHLPATMSHTILTDLLRGTLGFEGVIISDALEMGSIRQNFATDDVLCMTIGAGVDMLLPLGVYGPESLKALTELLDEAVALTEAGRIDEARVDDAVRRILTLKQKYGLLDQTDFAVTGEAVAAAVAGCGSAKHRKVAWELAEKALTLLWNRDGAFPIALEGGERVLILNTAASRAATWDFARQRLEEEKLLPEGVSFESLVIEPETAQACLEAAKAADRVLVISRDWDPSCLDPETENGFPVGVVNEIIDLCHADGRQVVVISAQLPYDAACFTDADAMLLAYCSSVMRDLPPANGAGSAYVPNLPAAICAAFGASVPSGRLPVSLPELDGGRPTDRILFERAAE